VQKAEQEQEIELFFNSIKSKDTWGKYNIWPLVRLLQRFFVLLGLASKLKEIVQIWYHYMLVTHLDVYHNY